MEFTAIFPKQNLAEILASFSSPKPLDEHIQKKAGQRSIPLDMLVWLLRKGYLSQLHEYIYLVPNSSIGREKLSERSFGRSFSKASDSELEVVEQLIQGKPAPVAALFRRLYPYFNGSYYKEEILWREGVSRNDLITVLSRFSTELVVCIHE